ncbi:hypothetical protein LOZ65_004602 [Ophidiomyces ophidiicola]|nr:hypothetical protein LOZ65_004602 [Ophidiomyces ophidiicola]
MEVVMECLSSAASSLPTASPHPTTSNAVSLHPPPNGISLLNTKNEIFLSYLQNVVFLFLLQLRQLPDKPSMSMNDLKLLQKDTIQKLTELQIYLKRGVRPLEAHLKYQIDKVLKAADDAERTRHFTRATRKKQSRQDSNSKHENSSTESDAGSESGSESSGHEDEVDKLAYRPNLAGLSKATEEAENGIPSASKLGDGIYRPPKIKPTALPVKPRGHGKSRVIDEFVSAEMSTAPVAEPSIGSTIRARGREVRTQREREIEGERRAYEETNFVRLPKESKKDRRGGRKQDGFGGEDWRSLGENADRIGQLTSHGRGTSRALEKSRKRQLTNDGPQSDSVGESFEKRRKKVAGWKK